MNHENGRSVIATGKKARFSSAARALVFGLALALPGTAALAGGPVTGTVGPVPGTATQTGIASPSARGRDGKLPSIAVTGNRTPPPPADVNGDGKPATIVNSGAQLQLAPGITVNTVNDAPGKAGGLLEPFEPAGDTVGTSRSNKKAGVAVGDVNGDGRAEMRTAQPDRASSITIHAQVGVETVAPNGSLLGTSRSNKKAGIAKGEEPPPDNVLPSAPVNTSRSNKKAGIAVGDVNGDGRAEIRTVPPKTDGTGKPQFKVTENESPRPTDRVFLDGNASPGIITGAGAIAGKGALSGVWSNGDGTDLINSAGPGGGPHRSKPIADQGAAGNLSSYGTAPPANNGTGQEQSTVRKAGERPVEYYGTTSPSRDLNGNAKPAARVTVNPVNDAPSKAATMGVDSGSSVTTKASGNPAPGFPGGFLPGIGLGAGGAGGAGAGHMSPAVSPMSPGSPMGASPMGPTGAGAMRR